MRILVCSVAGLVLASTSAYAQSAEAPAEADAAEAPAAEAAAPADATADASQVSDADIDSFAKATVKLQAIQQDTAIAADQKQTAMAAAVAEAGLDPAKYNAIGKAAAADATLRAKVQTAMSKYAPQPSEG